MGSALDKLNLSIKEVITYGSLIASLIFFAAQMQSEIKVLRVDVDSIKSRSAAFEKDTAASIAGIEKDSRTLLAAIEKELSSIRVALARIEERQATAQPRARPQE